MSDKNVTVSNELLLNLTFTFNQLSTVLDTLADNVANIELGENDKTLPVDSMPKNRYANTLYLLSSYAKLLDKNLQNEIIKAGGEI